MNVLVVGAGLAGLSAARALMEHGHEVRILERSGSPGGRLATRRILNGDADRPEHATLEFDHGAQYFTVRDTRFATEVEAWHKARVVQVWHGKLAAFDSEGRDPVEDDTTRWVGVPGMSAIARHLARSLDLGCGSRVEALEADTMDGAPTWFAQLATGGREGPFDAVVVAVPPVQAAALVAAAPSVTESIGRIRMHPCWAALVAFADRVAAPFDGAFALSSPLGWFARNRSKPQRGLAETWVLHASTGWSTAHVNDDADAVGAFLLNAFADLVRAPLPKPVHLSAVRWRHACPVAPAAAGPLADPAQRLAVCGDWLHGGRVEGAYLSGLEAATIVSGWRRDRHVAR